MAEIQKWRKFANAIKAKRTTGQTKKNANAKRNNDGGSSDVSILERKGLLVQPLATEATGKAKKYERTGPKEFVAFPYEELIIPNIIRACNKHFQKRLKSKSIDVLASERGPSCSKISQLPDPKLIHVRFVVNSSLSLSSSPFSDCKGLSSGVLRPPVSVPCSSISTSLKRRTSPPLRVNKFPKSLPVTAMMKLGSPISVTDCQNKTLVEVSSFDIEKMAWSTPIFVPFTIEKEEFGKGGFRSAHKAISGSPLFSTKAYVVKYFLEITKEIISKVGESELDHARKSVQMHLLPNISLRKLLLR